VGKATEPIRNTEAYKSFAETLVDALDDSGSAKHAGFEEKEARRMRRQLRLAKAGKDSMVRGGAQRIKSNPEAGQALVLHKDSGRQEKWNRLKETNPLFKKMSELRQQYDESENPVVSGIRSVTSTIGSWFDENESAQVQRLMKYMDPTFNIESFERELREYIVPEVVDAYLSADQEALKAWCGEAVSVSEGVLAVYLRSLRLTTYYGRPWKFTSSKVLSVTARCWTSGKSRYIVWFD
jgi:mitochondrial import inner membrane translocase subunit TIM44